MPERKDRDPYVTPEYWDGHEPGDDCQTLTPPNSSLRKELREERALGKQKKFAEEVLLDFLAKPEQDRIAIRTFKKGETFDAYEFPPGTIIGFTREQKSTSSDLPYYEGRRWGVVCSYKIDGEIKRTIHTYNAKIIEMNTHEGIPPLMTAYGLSQSPRITVGEVRHRSADNFMYRITQLAVYEVGKGVKQEEPEKSLLSKFAVVFPKLRPQQN